MSISAPRDNNRIPTLLATSNADGVTVVAVQVTNNQLNISDGTTGSGFSFVDAQRDANRIPAIWGVSAADGVTPIPIYCDINGNILTKST